MLGWDDVTNSLNEVGCIDIFGIELGGFVINAAGEADELDDGDEQF